MVMKKPAVAQQISPGKVVVAEATSYMSHSNSLKTTILHNVQYCINKSTDSRIWRKCCTNVPIETNISFKQIIFNLS